MFPMPGRYHLEDATIGQSCGTADGLRLVSVPHGHGGEDGSLINGVLVLRPLSWLKSALHSLEKSQRSQLPQDPQH